MRILFLSDPIWSKTGYGKVAFNVAKRLTERHTVGHLPMQRALQGTDLDYHGIQVFNSSQTDDFSEDVLASTYYRFQADVVITLKDIWSFRLINTLPLNYIPYVPIDHHPVSPFITHKLNTAFQVLTMSNFGKAQLEFRGIPSTYMPHGVDLDIYKPIEDKAACRKFLAVPEDTFLCGIVAMNRQRKLIPRQLRAFKRFMMDNPDQKISLMIWSDIDDTSMTAVNLRAVINQLGIDKSIYSPTEELYRQGLSDIDMAKLYNAFDVLLMCTGGEGAGLPILEANACGVPVIVSDYAGGPEYLVSGYIAEVADVEIFNPVGTGYALVDISDMVDKLNKVLNDDPQRHLRRTQKGIKMYGWDNVVTNYWMPFLEKAEILTRPLITKEGEKTYA